MSRKLFPLIAITIFIVNARLIRARVLTPERCGQTCLRELFRNYPPVPGAQIAKVDGYSRAKFITIFHKTRNQVNNSISTGELLLLLLLASYGAEVSLARQRADEITNLSIYAAQKRVRQDRPAGALPLSLNLCEEEKKR